MEKLEKLWIYQEAELKYEAFDREVKDTETRKEMLAKKAVFEKNQAVFKKLESESAVLANSLNEIAAQVTEAGKQMDRKKQEIAEMSDLEIEDLFLQDVRESIKECDSIRSSLETCKRKAVDIKTRVSAINDDILKVLRNMSAAKTAFDDLKVKYSEEIGSKSGEIEALRKEAEAAAKDVDPELMERYRKIKTRCRNPVAKLNVDRCSGCNMQLPASVLGKVKAGNEIVECDSCGRIIFM